MSHRFKNQYDIFDPSDFADKSILIVWAWGVGSTTAYALAQLGISNITVIDFDEVEDHNIATQFYKESQLWVPKVIALQQSIKEFTGTEISIFNEKFKPEHLKDIDIVIMGADSMDVRKQIAESCTTRQSRMIDIRMGGNVFEIYSYIPVYELELYMETWFPSSEASPTRCTEKAVNYNCLAIASFLTRIVKWLLMKEDEIINKNEWVVDLHNLLIW